MKKSIFAILVAFSIGAPAYGMNLVTAFAGVAPGAPACFVRKYNAAHLASKPKQTVRQIKVRLSTERLGSAAELSPIIAIQVLRKGENKTWTNNIVCMEYEGTVRCGVECDGGSVEIAKRDFQKGTLLLKNNGVLLYGGCGAEGADGQEVETIFLESKPGGDDLFLMPQVAPSQCADVSDEAH